MSQFGYVVALDLHDQSAVLVGGGREATHRLGALVASGAQVTVITPAASDDLRAALHDAGDRAVLVERDWQPGDLVGARIAICTGEDDTDVQGLWAESRAHHITTSVLDDLDHTDFAQPALVRRGDLRIAISTGGSAPALARRYREELERIFTPAHGDLVEAAHRARGVAGRRPVSFEEWAGRWACAVWDVHGLAQTVTDEGIDAVVDHIVATLLPTSDAVADPTTDPTLDHTSDLTSDVDPDPVSGSREAAA